ncbi:putative protein (DUF4376 domain) [Campylobacter hyointestinalis subsp. lawsonii CCUG 27631]|uniref:DUF4376 domain-containing protein n=1 Tax=Campylobacter hyointestinalis TaxID=198 RepID=UPI0007C90B9A|nr:DUF4376 domain-containing protein [Campylobacter hyointestinalis]ANE34351.1 putative protein (DUF4376 domain) [Campylobacter hyointestinalis subsp. lawsonii CCUG 27631]
MKLYDIKEKQIVELEYISNSEGTFYISGLSSSKLKSYGYKKVVEDDYPQNDDPYKEIIKTESYDEPSDIYNIHYELRDISLDDAKRVKLEELAELKAEKLASFEFNGNVFQLDGDSKVNINGKISQILLSATAGVPIENINWINKDNRVIHFSKDEFIAFGIAAANHSERVLFKHDELRNLVKNAKSIDELKGIEWIE